MFWFEESWGAPCCDPELRVPIPSIRCTHCGEEFQHGDRGFLQEEVREPITRRLVQPAYAFHFECQMRMVLGSVGHQRGRCQCYGGSEEDPPGMTRRQAAIAALDYFETGRLSIHQSLSKTIN